MVELTKQLKSHDLSNGQEQRTLEARRHFLKELLTAAIVSSTTPSWRARMHGQVLTCEWLTAVQGHINNMLQNKGKLGSLEFAVALFHAVHTHDSTSASIVEPRRHGEADSIAPLVELCGMMRSEEMWSVRKFEEEMAQLPELASLLSTPRW